MRVCFGQYVLDTDRRLLERERQLVHLSPKAFTMLEILIAERPRPVSKRVLLERVWPDVVVEEQNVKNTIVELRAALGDGADAIRTIQRFGYAFAADAYDQIIDAQCGDYWLYYEKRPFPITASDADLGRDPSCALCIDAPGVSRRHARLTVARNSVTIEDLGSKNGTWVGDQRISAPTALRSGDRIRIGSATLVFRSRGTVDSTTTHT